MKEPIDLVVFSHLRWDFVWQRPQHLLSRLAKIRRVLFIEEPVPSTGESRWETQKIGEGLTVCRLHSQGSSFGFDDVQLPNLRQHLPRLLHEQAVEDCIAWFYTPMALPLLNEVDARVVVYDCMDELSAFRGAPPQMLEREAGLLQAADIVFTGGPSLYAAKKDRHPNVYCFPSSVDAAHLGKAKEGIDEHPAQASLPHPRLGFFGVVDERFDVELFDGLAKAKPDWQFAVVGPVVKIDPNSLPRQSNIHYFGQRSYNDLPAFLAGWDVCLLPFARNDSTRFISPTKTLEYMAAEKPIVSTPITDVAVPYGDIVYLGNDLATFLAGCNQALTASDQERAHRIGRMREVLARTSWDSTAAAMSDLLEKTLERRWTAARAPEETAPEKSAAGESTPPVVVIGAGPTGLSAAYHLGKDALLLERNSTVGGWCRSIQEKGFTFDFAGHIMFSNDPYVHEMYKTLLGDNVHWQDREAWIYSKGVHTRYPFQGSLYGLPADVIKECIVGAIEARFGDLKGAGKETKPASNGHAVNGNGHPASGNGHAANGNGNSNGNGNCGTKNGTNGKHQEMGHQPPKEASLTDCCADGVLESTARLGKNKHANGQSAPPANFEEFIYKVWGAGIAKHFAIPYNRKLWSVPLTEMETSWLGGRVPLPDLGEMIEGALSPAPKPMGPNARFGYPLRGGFQALMNGFLPKLQGPVRLNAQVQRVLPSQHLIVLNDGTEVPYEQLISTMPLPVLVRQIGEEAPAEVRKAASRLRYISVRCVNIGVGRERLTDKHWIYYPEDTIFHRIFVQGSASPHCNPAGGFGLTCEITYDSKYKPLPVDGDDLIQRCITDCHRVGIFNPEDPIWTANQVDMPHAYVIYDHDRQKNVTIIREWLAMHNILLAGRYSEWEYYNSDHAFIAGKKAAEMARARLDQKAATAVLA